MDSDSPPPRGASPPDCPARASSFGEKEVGRPGAGRRVPRHVAERRRRARVRRRRLMLVLLVVGLALVLFLATNLITRDGSGSQSEVGASYGYHYEEADLLAAIPTTFLEVVGRR